MLQAGSPHGWGGKFGTIGQMRAIGTRSLIVRCLNCGHGAIINADRRTPDTTVAMIGNIMLCTKCDHVGAEVKPDWEEAKYFGH